MSGQDLTNFISNPFIDVVIGALIGGIFAYRGAMDAVNRSIKALYDQERRAKNFERNKLQKVVKISMISELKQNIEILEKGYRVGFATMILTVESWMLYRGSIDFFPANIQERIINLYADISRYNSLIEYDKAYVASGRSGGESILTSKIQDQASLIKSALSEVVSELES